ncbi:sulfatase-like hydrolase/transferase [Saccharopolyspora sp. NPDC000359]|uniref:sulfatase-like hydrolase/transferase n=1 Tax=Saccharopolyspora sp. NPDC000359 TaxID=3154251 RepID=UPI00332BF964
MGEERQPPPAGDYYLTDAIGEHAADFVARQADADRPFFLYLAFTAPHWPLHAPEGDVRRYAERFTAGWDELRAARHARLVEEGLVGDEAPLSERDPELVPWSETGAQSWEDRRMAVYAAQVTAMDRAIGRVMSTLEHSGAADDTLVVFLSDNGGCAEELPPPDAPKFRDRQPSRTPDGRPIKLGNDAGTWPGGEDTFCSYGKAWANLSNTSFRLYKRWVHEGGIATPLIAHWPGGGLDSGRIVHAPHQLTDVLPTLLEAAGIPFPAGPGSSLLAELRGEPDEPERMLFWEHVGNAAARRGRWKIVREAGGSWELYDMANDRSERWDLAAQEPGLVGELAASWQEWADSVGVVPWVTIRAAGR